MKLYRTSENYFMVMKEKSRVVLIRKFNSKKEILAEIPYHKPEVYISAQADNLNIQFSIGESQSNMVYLGPIQTLKAVSESKINKFNGPGIGMYATSNGKLSKNSAYFDWFEYSY